MSRLFVEPFEILNRVRKVSYRLVLAPKMSKVHNVFYVSMLRKHIYEPSHVVDYDDIEVSENVTSTERPVRILDHNVKKLWNRDITLVKF